MARVSPNVTAVRARNTAQTTAMFDRRGQEPRLFDSAKYFMQPLPIELYD